MVGGTSILHGKDKADRCLTGRRDGQKKPRVWARGGGSMSRDEKIREAYLLVSAYMRAEDVAKAREALERWAEVVKGVGNDD